MKKILTLSYFMLTWFICQGQSSFVVSPPSCGESNFVFFDSEGVLDYSFNGVEETYEVEQENILWDNNNVVLKGCEFDMIFVTDCKYIDQLLLVKNNIILYTYNFNGLKTATRD